MSLPDQLATHPRLQETAKTLRVGVNELRAHLANQGIHAGPDDRLPAAVVYAAVQAEVAAGRAWIVLPALP